MQVRLCLKVVLERWDWIFLGITTSFCEMLTVRPLLDQIWIILSFIWFLLNFVWFLPDFSFDSEPVWIIHYCEWQLARLQQYIFQFCCYSKSFCCTSEKWIVNLFSKALQKPVKVLKKPNIMLTLSSQLSFQTVCYFYRLRIKKMIKKRLDKNCSKTNWNHAWFTSGPIEGAQ